MTDLIILKRIPGHKRGEIVPRSERLEKHILAGNAKILPNEHEAWNGDPQPDPVAPRISVPMGMYSDIMHDDDLDLDPEWDPSSDGEQDD